ncbi:MAG: GDYXXLXY domain-containing protein [Candidatus Omnitrophica bacterium]|nr:GDYXXLXY domain-containing protein [Candidatus Omnitrophota bacterium]
MKSKLLMCIVGLQVLVLAYVAGKREWVLHTRRTVYLRTVPLDPRDPVRGDYVRLSYPVSIVQQSFCHGRLVSSNGTLEILPQDTPVYASLRVNEDGFGELVSLSTERPASGFFIRGRTESYLGSTVRVRYGLEAYFVEEGRGSEFEAGFDRGGIRVPLEMQVAVGAGGLAVLKDHRWCELGMGLELETTNPPAGGQGARLPRVVAIKVLLLNAGTRELAIVDRPGGRSMALVTDPRWGDNSFEWVHETNSLPAPRAGEVIVLKPGEVHTVRIRLDDPLWTVRNREAGPAGKAAQVKLADLEQDWGAWFRFEYRPPERPACVHLPLADRIWHGRLRSQAFSPGSGVD